jgi:hypothetical protein
MVHGPRRVDVMLFEAPYQGLQGCQENAGSVPWRDLSFAEGAARVSRMLVNVAVVAESEVLVALPGC